MNLVHSTSGRKRAGLVALVIAGLLAALALSAASAPVAKAATCPGFRVLHNDRIGPAVLPAGTYTVTTAPVSGLSCSQASALFARFLQDWDGVLPGNWRVVAQGRGKASFNRGNAAGFSVALGGGENEEEEETNPYIGRICPGTFTVNAGRPVGPLFFEKGQYLIYLPPRSLLGCNRATIVFNRFLSAPGGQLPSPWRLRNQTATFFRAPGPVRSAFRVEPAAGSFRPS